jgi:hypothetical protein
LAFNTSIFSLLDALLLRPLPGARSDGLVAIYRGDNRPCSYPDFLDFQDRGGAFSGLAADMTNESALDVRATSEIILIEGVSYNYASVLETRPSLGRWFSAQDERTTDEFPMVISYRVWQSRFGADPQVIGKRVRLESQWYIVVGVAARDFQGIALPVVTDAWVPLVTYAQHNDFAARLVKNRQGGRVMMFGRLKPGITRSQAQAQINIVDNQLRREYPRPDPQAVTLRVEPARGTPDPGSRRMGAQPVILLAVVVGLVLLIACTNIAGLLLTRGAARRREVSIRLALGASRARICRQTLIESLLLTLVGATAGLGAFGVLALLVATVGLYGVVAFGVRQRTQEFGIRMALGAERHDVLGLVISDVLALTLGGVGLGLFASVALTRLLRGFLYGLSPTDSATFVAVALVWTTVAVFASCVPAYHATKVDPLVALRYE